MTLRLLFSLALAQTATSPAAPPKTDAAPHAASEAAEGFRILHSDELAALLADSKHPIHLYDANHDAFRQEEGVIASATLLDNPHEYPTDTVLPADKAAPLVFYCSNRL